jgi:RNA polymerase-binding transcription factor DksA
MPNYSNLRAELESRLAEISSRVSRIEADLRRTPDRDWTEQATLQENDEVLGQLDELGRAEVAEIHRALRRIESGDYGMCVNCCHPIDHKRLEALPLTEKCAACTK